MAQGEFEIEIDAQGQVTIQTIGFKGKRCLEEAEAFAMTLGREESRQLTNEFYEAEQTMQTHIDLHHRFC